MLQSAPRLLADPVKDSGGIADWLWHGKESPKATIDVVTSVKDHDRNQFIRHTLSFSEVGRKFDLQDERIENEAPVNSEREPYFYYRFQQNHPVLNIKGQKRTLQRIDIDPEQSILSQRRDPDQYPEITELAKEYQKIRIYREWSFGRYSMPRQPQKADGRNDVLEENYHNLGLILNSPP